MTLIADWFPALPPAPTCRAQCLSAVRLSVGDAIISVGSAGKPGPQTGSPCEGKLLRRTSMVRKKVTTRCSLIRCWYESKTTLLMLCKMSSPSSHRLHATCLDLSCDEAWCGGCVAQRSKASVRSGQASRVGTAHGAVPQHAASRGSAVPLLWVCSAEECPPRQTLSKLGIIPPRPVYASSQSASTTFKFTLTSRSGLVETADACYFNSQGPA